MVRDSAVRRAGSATSAQCPVARLKEIAVLFGIVYIVLHIACAGGPRAVLELTDWNPSAMLPSSPVADAPKLWRRSEATPDKQDRFWGVCGLKDQDGKNADFFNSPNVPYYS